MGRRRSLCKKLLILGNPPDSFTWLPDPGLDSRPSRPRKVKFREETKGGGLTAPQTYCIFPTSAASSWGACVEMGVEGVESGGGTESCARLTLGDGPTSRGSGCQTQLPGVLGWGASTQCRGSARTTLGCSRGRAPRHGET